MRRLNKEEQSLVRLIVSSAQSNNCYLIVNILNPLLNGRGNSIGIDLLEGELCFYEIAGNPVTHENISISSILEIEAQLIERVLLIKQLEDNNLIYFVDQGASSFDGYLFCRDDYPSPVRKSFDKDLISVIKKSCERPIVCMPELINMVEDGFISEEERRHQEEMSTLKEQMTMSEKHHKELLDCQIEELHESNRKHEETIAQNEKFHNDEMIIKNEQVKNSNDDARKSRRLAIIVAISSAVFSALASTCIAKWVETTIDRDQIDSLVPRLTSPIETIDSLAVQIIDILELKSSEDSSLIQIQNDITKMRLEINEIKRNVDNSSNENIVAK